MDSKDTLLAFLLGATVGVAVGLLYAPKSGKETRDQLKQMSGDFADKSKKFVEEGKEKIAEVIEKGKAAYSKQTKKSSDIQEDIVE